MTPQTIAILAESQYGMLLLWCILALALIAAAFVGVSWLRKWLKSDETGAASPLGFTLSDLRALHKSGQMTTEEFERAKEKMVAAIKAAAERKQTPPTASSSGGAKGLGGIL